MQRHQAPARADWKSKVESLGLLFHSNEAPYWDESVYYAFTLPQVLEIERVTQELFRLCCLAVEHIFEAKLWARFQVPEALIPLLQRSWREDDVALYGRFDLGMDAAGVPKLYEFNADTPTSLFEASVVQWHWLREAHPACDQFNSIHEHLIDTWKRSEVPHPVHFACSRGSDEEFVTTVYLQDTALQAGLPTERLFIEEVGWDGRWFVDLQKRPIHTLFKLYPWEWMLREPFGIHLPKAPCQFIEPPWKMLLSNKEILVLLWELFPDHPNLLPAFSSPERLGARWIQKPVFGRGGAGITVHTETEPHTTPGAPAIECGFVYQAYAPPLAHEGYHPVLGSWIVGGEACGMGIRESVSPITLEGSRFVPHLIRP
ncbi:MAG: hypothetical protein RLZZ244_2726 [Verrucomicrobiota bacterium]